MSAGDFAELGGGSHAKAFLQYGDGWPKKTQKAAKNQNSMSSVDSG
jgi:hypothetical protein